MRRLALVTGIALVAIAFGAATRITNTREGLIAETIMYLAALVGLILIFYGLFGGARPAEKRDVPRSHAVPSPPSSRQFALGAGGLALAAILISGSGLTAGWQWAALSSVMLLPMIVGSAILCARFLRAR